MRRWWNDHWRIHCHLFNSRDSKGWEPNPNLKYQKSEVLKDHPFEHLQYRWINDSASILQAIDVLCSGVLVTHYLWLELIITTIHEDTTNWVETWKDEKLQIQKCPLHLLPFVWVKNHRYQWISLWRDKLQLGPRYVYPTQCGTGWDRYTPFKFLKLVNFYWICSIVFSRGKPKCKCFWYG